MTEQRIVRLAWLAIILVVLYFGWPTPWRYEQHAGELVRINRISGRVDILLGGRFSPHVRATPAEANAIMRKYGLDTLP